MKKTLGTPEPHSDVLNKEPKTLLLGYGWVGQFVHKYFKQADYWTPSRGLFLKKVWDKKEKSEVEDYGFYEPFQKHGMDSLKKGFNGLEEDERWEVAFISVPTPMLPSGRCDTSVVEEVVKKWHKHVDLFIIRSTVELGTTTMLQQMYPHNKFVMQPEYLGETLGHPLTEPARDTFIILGGEKRATEHAAEVWSKVLNANCKIRQTTAETAELCKYMENSFLAVKVLFVSQFRKLADKIGVDFMELREAWLDDPRIGRSHTMAYKDNPGFSGKCLPKDVNAICYTAAELGTNLELLEEVLKINASMRRNYKNTVPLLPKK